MSNWLQRPSTQHLLASLGALGAGVVLPCYFPDGWIAGAAGAVGGVGGNLVSNFFAKFFDHRENHPTRPDVNSDLLRLIANAIAKEIANCARETVTLDAAERQRVEAFAPRVVSAFVTLIEQEELPDIAPPDVKQLLTAAARDQAAARRYSRGMAAACQTTQPPLCSRHRRRNRGITRSATARTAMGCDSQ